jgi:AcrR family transcriptional regulator
LEASVTEVSEGGKTRYDKKREEVVSVAAKIFAEKGYHATSIDDLVRATQLQRGGLYHYISGKKDLLIHIHERFAEPVMQEAREIAALDKPPDQVLRMLAHTLLEAIERHRDEVTVFLQEWRTVKDDPRWENVRAIRKEFENIVVEVLERGRREGIFEISDSRIAMYTFLGMINYTYQWFDPEGKVRAYELAEQMCDIFLDGVKSS